MDRMIRSSVRRRFRSVRLLSCAGGVAAPCILVANHHGWHDGYLMHLLAARLGLPAELWIREFDAFPLFRLVGGLPFPDGDANRRAGSIRHSIRGLRQGHACLVMFPEGELHRAPELMPFLPALAKVAALVPNAAIVPVGIRYEMGIHERPEAYVSVGERLRGGECLAEEARASVRHELERIECELRTGGHEFEVLAVGARDVNERMDMRRIPALTNRRNRRR